MDTMLLTRCYSFCFSWQAADSDTFLSSHITHPASYSYYVYIFSDFVPLSSSSCASLQGTVTVKLAKQEGFSSAGISFQTADLPVTSLSPQLSATFTTAAIMQNNLISHLLTSPTSTDCPTPSPSPERNPSGLFTCSPCCLTRSCSWHPVVFHLFQVCVVPC